MLASRLSRPAPCCVALALAAVVGLAAATTADAAALRSGLRVTTLVRGLTAPTGVAFAPDGRIFVAEQAGRVLVVNPGQSNALLLDISAHVNSHHERGLSAIAVDSAFASNGFLYLAYTHNPAGAADDDVPRTARVTRVTVSRRNDVGGETVILGRESTAPCPGASNSVDCIATDSISHSIGAVRSVRGTLWVATGDGGQLAGDNPRAFGATDERSLNGKLLHVSRDGRGLPGHPFCKRNPRLTDNCTKVFAKGFRNPFRFAVRSPNEVLVGDVGAAYADELNRAQPGRDYGWPCYEAETESGDYHRTARCRALYARDRRGPKASLNPPFRRLRGNGTVLVGGPVAPASFPAPIRGRALFADYVRGQLLAIPLVGSAGLGRPLSVGSGLGGPVMLEPRPNSVVYVDFAGRRAGEGRVCEIYASRRPGSTSCD